MESRWCAVRGIESEKNGDDNGLRGGVKIIGQSVGSQVDLQIIVVVPRARLLSDGLSQGANHFLPGVSQTGLSSQMSPECLPGDAEWGAVTDGVRGELKPEPTTRLSFCGLQRLKASLVVAVGGGRRVAAAGRQTFLALQYTPAVQFVSVRGRLAGVDLSLRKKQTEPS